MTQWATSSGEPVAGVAGWLQVGQETSRRELPPALGTLPGASV